MEKNNRIRFIDIAKGIAIICIIIGHLDIKEINRFVYTFHVPIFFIITGYFINNKLSINEFISKKFKTLIIPYIITCIVIIILATIKSIITSGVGAGIITAIEWLCASVYGAGDTYFEPFYIKAIGAIWFLLATFWGSAFLRLSLEMKKKYRVGLILILFIAGIFSGKIFWFPFSLQAGCCATLFMYVGYLFKKSKEKILNLNFKSKILFIILMLIIWIQFIINFESFWLVHCDIGRGIIDIVGSICGAYIIILLSFFIEKYFKRISNFFAFWGRYSLFVLCIHIIELNLFDWKKIVLVFLKNEFLTEYSFIFFLVFLKLLFILIITYICSKSNFIKRIFGMSDNKTKLA